MQTNGRTKADENVQLPRALRSFEPTLRDHPLAVGITLASLFFGGLSILVLSGELGLSHFREKRIADEIGQTLRDVQTTLVLTNSKLQEIDKEGDTRSDILKELSVQLRSLHYLMSEIAKKEGVSFIPPEAPDIEIQERIEDEDRRRRMNGNNQFGAIPNFLRQ